MGDGNGLLGERERGAARREWRADARDRRADERDRVADARERLLDERERAVGRRERRADERDRLSAQRRVEQAQIDAVVAAGGNTPPSGSAPALSERGRALEPRVQRALDEASEISSISRELRTALHPDAADGVALP